MAISNPILASSQFQHKISNEYVIKIEIVTVDEGAIVYAFAIALAFEFTMFAAGNF